jgi:hypothetical protein
MGLLSITITRRATAVKAVSVFGQALFPATTSTMQQWII